MSVTGETGPASEPPPAPAPAADHDRSSGQRSDGDEPVELRFVGAPEIAGLGLGDGEILDAVEAALRAQGLGQTVLEPRVHLEPDPAFNGHFNVLRGYVAPLHLAGVKVVGDYVDNYRRGLPSEMALLNLFDPETGAPRAVLEATAITTMRTGAMTAIGARHLARGDSSVLGHVGARGTAYWNIRLLHAVLGLAEVRIHSRRPESCQALARRVAADLGVTARAVTSWQECVEGCDVVVEASRRERPEPLLKTSWIAQGSYLVPYGTMSALELSLLDVVDKVVVDDWGQCREGRFGALRAHVRAGLLDEARLHAELCQLVIGAKPGRESAEETDLLWHRGLATTDIALGELVLRRAEDSGGGTVLRLR